MIRLYQFPPALGLRNPSPFCLKIQLALQLSGLPHEVIELADPRRAPLAKLPYIEDDGVAVPDSERIMVHLRERHGFDLDARLEARERGFALAVTRLAEEHLYWLMLASRWFDDDCWPALQAAFFAPLPALLRPVLVPMIRKGTRRTYEGQGLGRHPLAAQQQFGQRDLQAVVDMLGPEGLLFDDAISAADLALYCVLDGILRGELVTWLGDIARTMPRLQQFLEDFDAAFERTLAGQATA